MKNIKILDCTLRDGGRIIDCAFRDKDICAIAHKLSKAKINIIEVGFLRDANIVSYHGNSTFFTDVSQISNIIGAKDDRTILTVFIDYGMYDFNNLSPFEGNSVDGIRVGFTKNDFINDIEGIKSSLIKVKKEGYKLFVQSVNSLAYSDMELLKLIEIINEIEPYSFGIVDTYGAMYRDDVERIYKLIDYNLKEDIHIDFHSHNNFQLSFALAQEIIQLSNGIRPVIIDATLGGMGKGAGNLNTELIIDYLIRKKNYDFEFDKILDIIDEHLYDIKKNNNWGYSIPSLMSGLYKSHPNNVIYLTSNFRVDTKDIKNIMSMIDENVRQHYDYENIERLYIEYIADKIDDSAALEHIKQAIKCREVLVLVPGESLNEYHDKIEKYVKEKAPFIISVNFISSIGNGTAFYGNAKRYRMDKDKIKGIIVTSNIKEAEKKDYCINYYGLIDRRYKYFDNSTVMLLNMLKKIEVENITIAGFDGFSSEVLSNYINDDFNNTRHVENYEEMNQSLMKNFSDYVKTVIEKCNIKFLTPSRFESVMEKIYFNRR